MTRRFSTAVCGFLVVALAAISAASTGGAQEPDLEGLGAEAEQGDAGAQRILGEALVFGIGGAEQDVEAGRRLLEAAAAAGDNRAKASLGKILLDGYYLPAEPLKALPLLEEAASAGVAQARASLGGALLWGEVVEPEPARARVLLQQAAQQGDDDALRILGEQLVGGWVLDRDAETGLAMLEEAIRKGDRKAKVALGALLLHGTGVPADPRRALALFEFAAAAGNGAGLKHYGEWLMWSERDPAAAETYLQRAGELGEGSAWTGLAEGAMYGYLPPHSRAKFDGYAERARAAGEERIATLEAARRMWGISMRASGPETIELLEQAAEDGNASALKYLVALVRDGNNLNVRKRPDQARDYLERFGDLLTPKEAEQLAMTVDAAVAKDPSAYAVIAENLGRHPELKSVWFGKELYRANPNVAVFVLQADMKRRGVYSGPLNGLATRTTLRALFRDCMTLQDTARCGDSVMHPDVVGALLAR